MRITNAEWCIHNGIDFEDLWQAYVAGYTEILLGNHVLHKVPGMKNSHYLQHWLDKEHDDELDAYGMR